MTPDFSKYRLEGDNSAYRLLYAQEAVAADAGRGVGAGKFFTRDHRHLATVVQEGIFRSA